MNKEELRNTARLARLSLDEAELDRAYPAFERMLEFFAAMQTSDSENKNVLAASPESGTSPGTVDSQVFRLDSPLNNAHHTASNGINPKNPQENLVNNAGERDGRFIVVPNVL